MRSSGVASLSKTGLSNGLTSAKMHATSPNLTEMSKIHLGVDSALLEKTEKILTMYMGPIAKILVKKMSKQTSDRLEFFRLLAENLPTTADRSKFMQEVEAN